ncbi:uncharacterized protein LOC129311840 [Prosopis cineraria]|uniref:uncharacterized protein LOC129311840 n=1 Tax=Prosopis cineraria TaxID=364024 RepID=UPI00240F8237|nr:uncharacterized protein LOC129311840 [Prosopis cineraria]
MASVYVFRVIFLLSCLLLPLHVAVESKCPTSFDCGYLGKIQFPWTTSEYSDCGLFVIQGCDGPNVPKTLPSNKGTTLEVLTVSHSVSAESTIVIRDLGLHDRLRNRNCEAFTSNYTLPLTFPSPLASFKMTNIVLFFRCNRTLHVRNPGSFFNFTCGDSDVIYYDRTYPESNQSHSLLLSSSCSVIQFPVKDLPDTYDPFTFIASSVVLQVRLSDDCSKCHYDKAGHCQLDPNRIFYCEGGTI